jgi:hypothetical protein
MSPSIIRAVPDGSAVAVAAVTRTGVPDAAATDGAIP